MKQKTRQEKKWEKKWEILVNWYNYKYKIQDLWKNEDWYNISKFICKSANINQEFPTEDIAWLIEDLPNIIKKLTINKKIKLIRFRCSNEQKTQLQKLAKKENKTISSFILDKCL